MTRMRMIALTMAGAAAASTAPVAASAQSLADFYRGKTVRVIVGFSSGGGYDQYARLLVRHIGRHTPGNPAFIVQNMPGAASLKSVVYLQQQAPVDGTTIATFNPGLISQSLTMPEKVNVDFRRFAWIGNISEDFRVCFIWGAKNLKTLDQVRSAKEIVFGTTGVGTSAYIEGRMLDEIFGVKLRQVQGYPGSADKRIAIERGELDGDCGSWTSLPDDWLRDNKINLFVRFSRNTTADMPKDITFAGSLLKDPETRATYDLLMSGAEIGRPYIGPPGLLSDRLDALRNAFNATMKDAEFLADAKKQRLEVNPQTGQEVAAQLAEIYKTSPAAIKRARAISGE
ncbi:MAG: Bug family tripartite tricarboxylate transporter substrate binding protein [Beijerinckiaceae bacterium]